MNTINELTGKDLSEAVAKMLVSLGQLQRETMQEGYWKEDPYNQRNPLKVWLTILDGDEVGWELYANYATDPAHALTLTVEGYYLHVYEGNDGQWFAHYAPAPSNESVSSYSVYSGRTPSEAICRAWLGLAEYVKAKRP